MCSQRKERPSLVQSKKKRKRTIPKVRGGQDQRKHRQQTAKFQLLFFDHPPYTKGKPLSKYTHAPNTPVPKISYWKKVLSDL